MRTLKKVGWSWDGNKESDRDAVGHNSIPDSSMNFSCGRAADMTPVVWCSHKHLIAGWSWLALSLPTHSTATSFNLADQRLYAVHSAVKPRLRRGGFDADFHHYRLEFPSHHGVVRRSLFFRQLYNRHRYALDRPYRRRDRLLFRRKVVHRLSFSKLGHLARLPPPYLLSRPSLPSGQAHATFVPCRATEKFPRADHPWSSVLVMELWQFAGWM